MTESNKKYFSPYIQSTFVQTPNRTVREEYRERIKQLYFSKYEDLEKLETENSLDLKGINELLSTAEKVDHSHAKIEENVVNNVNADEKKGEQPQQQPEKEEKKEEKVEKSGQKKLHRALTLLDEEYFGREHELYEFLCQKYNVTQLLEEYLPQRYFPPLINEQLMQNERIKCYECQQEYIPSEFPNEEWRNGYFLACKRCAPDRNNVETLKWSQTFKSTEVILDHNNQVARLAMTSHRNALIDMKAMKNGVHCFRWKTKAYQTWHFWGIAVPAKYPNSAYNHAKTYGIGGSNQSFKNGACAYNVNTNHFFGGKQEVIIDMLLDLNKGELKFKTPGNVQESKLTGIPVNEIAGFVPLSGLHYSGCSVQIKKIPHSWYGKNPKRVKFQY